jgi:hypothetical protein
MDLMPPLTVASPAEARKKTFGFRVGLRWSASYGSGGGAGTSPELEKMGEIRRKVGA